MDSGRSGCHWFSARPKPRREKYTWIVIRHEIDYKNKGICREEIIATTWVGEPTRISWERFTEITRGESLLVKARSVWCLIDRETSKPMRISSELKRIIQIEDLNQRISKCFKVGF
jgi:acyl-CoA thioester hydrolase